MARLNTKDAAEHCGVSQSYLIKLRTEGGGPHYFKLGARVVYDVDDLDSWLETKKRASTGVPVLRPKRNKIIG